jgi:hypothetical protein
MIAMATEPLLPPSERDVTPDSQQIVTRLLTVKSPNGLANVQIGAWGNTAGIWVNTGKGHECIGLVAQQGCGPYLVIYDQKGIDGLPPVAITKDHIQLPKESNPKDAVVIPFKDLIAAIRMVKEQQQ